MPPADAAARPNDTVRDGENLKGEQTGDLTASFDKATLLLDQLTQTAKKADLLLDKVTTLAGDPKIQGGLQQTVGNINAASANGLKLTDKLNGLLLSDNAQVQTLLRQTQAGAQVSLDNIAATTASIRDTTRENRSQIAAIVRNLNDTTSSVAGITGQANESLKASPRNLQATVANLKTTTDNLAATTAKFNAIAGNLQSLTGDPKVQSNLRETVANLAASSGQATLLIERLNHLAGVRSKAAAVVVPGGPTVIVPGGVPTVQTTPAPAQGAPYYLPRVEALVNTRQRRFRTDIDAVVPLSVAPVTFARAGIYDFAGRKQADLAGRARAGDGRQGGCPRGHLRFQAFSRRRRGPGPARDALAGHLRPEQLSLRRQRRPDARPGAGPRRRRRESEPPCRPHRLEYPDRPGIPTEGQSIIDTIGLRRISSLGFHVEAITQRKNTP